MIGIPDYPVIEGDDRHRHRRGLGNDAQPLLALLDRLLRLLHVGDVGVGRDRATVIGLALVDLDPAPVGAALHMRALGIAMPGQTFRDPGLDVSLRVADLAARRRIAEDRFERYALIHDIDAAGAVHVPVPPVVYHQLVIGIVERETLRDALDRVGHPALGLRCLVARSCQLFLSPFEFGHVRKHGNGTAILRLTLTDLDPATVPLMLEKRPTGVVMPGKSLLHPFLRSCSCIGHDAAL